MDNQQVLSSEEVDALLKVSQERGAEISNSTEDGNPENGVQDAQILNGITELLRDEFEKIFSNFLRKKIVVKTKSFEHVPVSTVLGEQKEKRVYSVFKIMPNDRYGMFIVDLSLLHHSINILFGGQLNKDDPVIESPGKVGIVVTEKLSQLFLSGFTAACKEYGNVSCEVTKTTHLANLITNFDNQDKICLMEMAIFIEEIEVPLRLVIVEQFFKEFIPAKTGFKHREKDFWRTAIKSQVVDSYVQINVALPDVSMKVKDFMELKEGDVIPIGDPTLVYVCLNSIKLFRATAGQANNKLVVKVVNQI